MLSRTGAVFNRQNVVGKGILSVVPLPSFVLHCGSPQLSLSLLPSCFSLPQRPRNGCLRHRSHERVPTVVGMQAILRLRQQLVLDIAEFDSKSLGFQAEVAFEHLRSAKLSAHFAVDE